MPRKKKDVAEEKPKQEVVVETDADIDKQEREEEVEKSEVEIGSYKHHLESTKKGMFDYRIWPNLTIALLAQAEPNVYHRVDLRDKDFLKKIEKDMELKIDYDYLNSQIALRPWLIQPNGTFAKNVKENRDPSKDEYGKPLTKKAMKVNAKRDKIQGKIDILQKKYNDMKSKKGPRAAKLLEKIQELETKKDRT
jgi:hypothetical protein